MKENWLTQAVDSIAISRRKKRGPSVFNCQLVSKKTWVARGTFWKPSAYFCGPGPNGSKHKKDIVKLTQTADRREGTTAWDTFSVQF